MAVPLSLPGFGSLVEEEAVAVLDNVPPVDAPTFTVSVKTALLTPRLAIEQVTLPPAPTAGVVQVQPPGEASDTKVVPGGKVSESDTEAALLGPELVTVIV